MRIRVTSVLRGRCPQCDKGQILHKIFGIHPRCQGCGLDFYPEPGYFLGAMTVSFLATAMLTIPPMVLLKALQVDLMVVLTYPFVQFLVLGPLLMIYSRVLWIHLEYQMTKRLEEKGK